MKSQKVTFKNSSGFELSARLELPADQKPDAFALFAHCFTCNKNLTAIKNISRALNQRGIAVLRFDFTGLGESEGEFAATNFTSNIFDLLAASQWLQENHKAPELIIGHSLGGAAVIRAAHNLKSIKAVVTIGAPFTPEHVTHLLAGGLETIEEKGEDTIDIGGRPFKIRKQFIDDLKSQKPETIVKHLRKPLLVMHSPQDQTVSIEQAAKIYQIAHHPKSFVSLDGADHLLTRKEDSLYVGEVIAGWSGRYLSKPVEAQLSTKHQVVARLNQENGFTTEMKASKHALIADEPESVGGNNFGPSPYDYLTSALAACTVITLKMYAERKQLPLEEVIVHINHEKKVPEGAVQQLKKDHFFKRIELTGNLDQKQRERLLEIASRCPVHRTLMNEVYIHSELG